MNKKVISSVLAGAMALSTMGVVASAATDNKTTEGTNALTGKASLMEAKINANIPADLETYINPYGAAVSAENTANVETTVKYSDGLISPTYKIENLDDGAGLKINATATITPSSTVAVMTKAMDDVKLQKATEKQVFAFLNTTKDSAASKPVFASTKYVGNEQQVVFTEDGTKAANIATLPKVGTADTAELAATCWFYVGGQCTPNPETAWDSKDNITLNLVLDLSPSAGEAPDLSLASITLDAAGSTSIEKEFDGTKTTYELAASGSLTKAASIAVTVKNKGVTADTDNGIAEVKGANVYVKYNGKFYGANATADTGVPGITLTANVPGTKAGKAVVTPPKNAAATPAVDNYNVGDVLEFIVVDGETNESITYTIKFI